MSESKQDLVSLFMAAVEIQDAVERENMLKGSCADPAIKEQVDALLGAHGKARDFLSTPPQQVAVTSAFRKRPDAQQSIISGLQDEHHIKSVFLQPTDPEMDEPMMRPTSTEIPKRNADDKYQLQGEIARGGMGAILKGRDVDLGRSLAVKVLLETHKDKPEIIQRFIEEAQIGGQLQHPGIAPVYELGQFADRRPFFTMKLVKGKTLAALLLERKNVFDRGKLLGIFEQICQTMAYAHSRGVIHRDLKPANIMVGAFGEVQVMDWGVAKVMESGGVADEQKARNLHSPNSVIQTFRSDGSGPAMVGTDPVHGSQTLAGSVMGTPAYMPPEQARGEVERLDERCDVFGLGAILCEILTGRPPYFDDNPREVLYLAQQGSLEIAFKDLGNCRADKELVQIAKECLAPEPNKRVRNAKILAERMSGYLESVETRLHETEVARAAEAAKAIEERKRRKVVFALAASILLMFVSGAVAWIWNQQQQNRRQIAANDKVNMALGEARLHHELAASETLARSVNELEIALTNARTASELAEDGLVDEGLRKTASETVDDMQSALVAAQNEAELAERDRNLKESLEIIRLSHADGRNKIDMTAADDNFDKVATSDRYAQAFREANLDIVKLPAPMVIEQIKTSPIRESIIVALDHWTRNHPRPSIRDKFNASMGAGNWKEAVEVGLQRIEEDPGRDLYWLNVAPSIAATGDRQAYSDFCKKAIEQFGSSKSVVNQERILKACMILADAVPIDDIPNQELFEALDRDKFPARYSRHWKSWAWSARALWCYRKQQFDAVIDFVNESESLEPHKYCHAFNLCVLALTENAVEQKEEAELRLQTAEQEIRSCLETYDKVSHDVVIAWMLFREAEKEITGKNQKSAFALDLFSGQTRLKQSESARILTRQSLVSKLKFITDSVDTSRWRRAVRLAMRSRNIVNLKKLASGIEARGQTPDLLVWLSAALRDSNQIALAQSLLEQTQRENPGDFWVNYELGKSLIALERQEEGLGFCRAAFAIRPESIGAEWLVVSALIDSGKTADAERQFAQLLSRSEIDGPAYYSLGYSLKNRAKYKLAEQAYRKAISLNPERPAYHLMLAYVLEKQGRIEEASAELQKAISKDSNDAFLHNQFGLFFYKLKNFDAATECYRKSLELDSHNSRTYRYLGLLCKEKQQTEAAVAHFQKAVELDPSSVDAREHLIAGLRQSGRLEDAFREQEKLDRITSDVETRLRKQLESKPDSASTHYLLGKNLYDQRRWTEAELLFEEAVRLDRNNPIYRQYYGIVLKYVGKLSESIIQIEKAIEIDPGRSKYYYSLANSLIALGRDKEAITKLKKAIAIDPNYLTPYRELSRLQRRVGDPEAALKTAQEAVDLSPMDPRLRAQLGSQYRDLGRLEEGRLQFEKAKQQSGNRINIIGLIGAVYRREGNYEESIRTFEDGLGKRENPALRYGLAQSQLAFGYPRKAIANIELAIKGAKSKSLQGRALLAKGTCLIRLGRYEEAIRHLEAASRKHPKLLVLVTSRIWAKMLAGNRREAFEEIRQFVTNVPDHSGGHNLWAWMLVVEPDENGNYSETDQAIQHARKSVALLPNPGNLNTLGVAHFRAGNWKDAVTALTRSVDLGYANPENWTFLAMANAKLGETTAANEWYQKCLEWKKPRQLDGELRLFYAEAREVIGEIN